MFNRKLSLVLRVVTAGFSYLSRSKLAFTLAHMNLGKWIALQMPDFLSGNSS
nr:hypothetical protein [uncultured Undibacterium sp.]